MKKLIDSIFVFLFLAALVWAGLTTTLAEKKGYTYYENRMLASMPEATEENVADGSFFSALETYLSDHTALREDMVLFSTNVDIHVLKRPVVNDIVIQEDILLPFHSYEVLSEEDMGAQVDELADNLKSIDTAVESYGGVYCYVALPGQYSYFQDQYPEYLNNRSEYMALSLALLSDALDTRDINFLDLGPTYEALGYPAKLSSRVDNHFSAQGAFVAYQTILNTLNRDYGADFSVLSESDLDFTPVDMHYLGARARKICDLITFDEPLYAMTPRQPVPFRRWDNGTETTSAVLIPPAENETSVTYSYFMGGDIALTQINTDREDLPTVLLYGDSFTNAIEAILYLNCDTMYSIDLRHYSEKTITEFVLETQPDYVICLRDYGVLISPKDNGGP